MKQNKKIAIILYARFPSEMAYGNHIIQIANSFSNNGLSVNVYYPHTSNKKTINEYPEDYYIVNKDINFMKIPNWDITRLRIYEILPSVIKKFLYTLNTFFWSKKLIKFLQDEELAWSTNPNILSVISSKFEKVIYEKHGEGKFIQKLSIKILSWKKNYYPVAVTKRSKIELENSFNSPIYLPNGVDDSLFRYKERPKNQIITIGYIGFLETYGVDKGVYDAVKKIVNINKHENTLTKITGGPKSKIEEINEYILKHNQKNNFQFSDQIQFEKVPNEIAGFDIGIVPYPNNTHFNLYASPLKIFEFAAMGIPILASDIKSNLDLKELGIGLVYFEANNFQDFEVKLLELVSNADLRKELREMSLENIKNYSWNNRCKIILESIRSSTG